MTTTVSTTLRERALAAHMASVEEHRQQRVKEERDRLAEQARHLKRLLAENLGIESDPTTNEWIEDGITFCCRYDVFEYRWHLYILKPCPDCDGHRASVNLCSLEDLGAALHGSMWIPHEHWYEDGNEPEQAEAPVPPPPTTEEMLLEALRAFVAERIASEAY